MFCGGLRICELERLCLEDLEETDEGYKITFRGSKEKQLVKMRTFLIPSRLQTPYKERVEEYIKKIKEDTNECTGPLFRGCPKKTKFVRTPFGKNLMADVPKEIATFLKLKNPKSYTGHSFRRSSATNAAANNASTFVMQTHFGWSDSKTALCYIDSNAGIMAVR